MRTLEDREGHEMIILRWILGSLVVRMETWWNCFKILFSGELCFQWC